MKLIAGLGNPGRGYKKTRHNTGYMFVDSILSKLKLKEKEDKTFNACIACEVVAGEKIVFAKPLTYMNSSGDAVRKIVDYYHIPISDVLIVYDDVDLDLGKMRIRKEGSSGGHKGMQSIIDALNTKEIKRIRIGIGHADIDVIDYVLGKFSKEERKIIGEVFDKAEKIINDFASLDFDNLMNRYN